MFAAFPDASEEPSAIYFSNLFLLFYGQLGSIELSAFDSCRQVGVFIFSLAWVFVLVLETHKGLKSFWRALTSANRIGGGSVTPPRHNKSRATTGPLTCRNLFRRESYLGQTGNVICFLGIVTRIMFGSNGQTCHLSLMNCFPSAFPGHPVSH